MLTQRDFGLVSAVVRLLDSAVFFVLLRCICSFRSSSFGPYFSVLLLTGGSGVVGGGYYWRSRDSPPRELRQCQV